MAELFTLPARATDSNGTILPGAKLYFYATGTTTPQSVYTTAALSVAHANPVVADSGGNFAPIYLDPSLSYRAVLKSSDGATTVFDVDPCDNTGTALTPTTFFSSQAELEADSASWFFMPSDTDFTVSGTLAKKFFGPGSISLAGGNSPGDQGGAGYGFSVFEGVTPGSGQKFTFVAKNWTGTRYDRGSAPGQNHLVAGYFESTRGTGSTDGVWALNSITNAINLDGPTIGFEIDMNNQSGSDPGLNPANVYHALSLISGDLYRGGTGLVIDRNGDHPNNHWNRGIHIKEIWSRGIEFSNCVNGSTGIWADRTFALVQTASTDVPVMRLTPYDDLNPSGSLLYLTNAANDAVKASWLKRGEISIGGNANQGSSGIGVKGIANGDNLVFLQRNTDSTPTGTFVRAVDAANTIVLFDVDYNSTALETNLRLSVAGAAASRVSVGDADSGGTGYRVLRVPN